VLLAATCWLFIKERSPKDAAPEEAGITRPETVESPIAKITGESLPPSGESEQLNATGGSIDRDLRILDRIFSKYRMVFKGGNPVGLNREVAAALAGENPLGIVFISPAHPAWNKKGELTDRWGTPFFFHALASDIMEIRSAGPDRVLWSADDALLTPARADSTGIAKALQPR